VVRADAEKKSPKEVITFGTLRTASPEEARGLALAWLKRVGKTDAATMKAFEAVWADKDRPVLDAVADTLTLGDADAARLLEEARDPSVPAPQSLPAALKDTKRPGFYRQNLGLAYAKALSNRRVYEEALDALKSVKPEQVVDPVTYLFHRAVAEHALLQREEANRSILRLLDDAIDVPDRYKMVSVLMAFDMQSWKEKDIGDIARKMDNIERRLELARGGPKTQKIQKDVLARLDELIKELENQCKGDCNGGCCPNGGNKAGQGPTPMRDSVLGGRRGPGNVDQKKLEVMAKGWGKLPEKERAKAMQELTRDMPARYREITEEYFRKLASESSRP
jgi:hypothetical protein